MMNERMKDMKTKLMIMAVGMLMVCLLPLAANAQAQEWQSTSAMKTSGSNYTPQVNAVGATTAPSVATTTESYSPAKAPGGPRRAYDANGNWVPDSDDFGGGAETGESDQSPIGDAMLPLMLMAMLFAGVAYTRRKKALN